MSKHRLSKAEQARRMALYNKGLTDPELAKAFHLSLAGVSSWRQKHGLAAVRQDRLSREEHAQRMVLYHLGLTDQEMGEQLYISATTIGRWRNQRGLKPNGSPGRRKKPQKTEEAGAELSSPVPEQTKAGPDSSRDETTGQKE